jgi:hypothetical protein
MNRSAVLLLCIAFPCHAGLALADAEASILDRMLAAHGGVKAIGATDAIVQRGTTVSTLRGGAGPVTRAWQYPMRFSIEIGRTGRPPERRVLAGASGWRDGKPATGPLYSSMVLQAGRIVLPRLLHEHRDRVESLADRANDAGERVHVLRLELGRGLTLIAECDPETARIRRSRGLLVQGSQRLEFAAVYSDYRTLPNGLLMAFREDHLAMNTSIGHTRLDSVEILTALPESALEP